MEHALKAAVEAAAPSGARYARPTTLEAFEKAADGVEGGEQARQVMADAYARLISTRPETLLTQMQGYAAVAAREVRGDDLIGEVVRADWMSIRETVRLSSGADADKTASFFACGMLGNTLTAIGHPLGAGRCGRCGRCGR
ncbi:hypothetical protein [Streptomyces zaehneri]|uniref:hypothetical protein n=1 Tax=Streptomyces zaehneri TaxID=3051180 RepID=UPI0028D405DD|nr:hypothetical protein [Streptomyces sp. DSM 40713]